MTVLNTATKVYRGSTAVDAIYAGTNKVWPVGLPAAPTWKLVTAFNHIEYRSDYSGQVGMRIRMATDKTIQWLGLRCGAGNAGNHTVYLYDWTTEALLRTAVIDLTGKTEGVFYYARIAPITLTFATSYYALMVPVSAGGQLWTETTAVSVGSEVDQTYSLYSGSSSGGPLSLATFGQSYVGLDIGAD